MNTKINKLLLTVGLSASAISANAIFVNFDIWGAYNDNDVRTQSGYAPFPVIFHYNNGGLNSTWDEIRISAQQPTFEQLPESLRNFIQANGYLNGNIQYFEAYAKSEQPDCNYFTHTWSMDKMIEDRTTSVSTGMFEAHNLAPFVNESGINEVGINNLVAQDMYFHDGESLSGNVARFAIVDPKELADAWFISVYNPRDNDGNVAANKHQQVIVVHWYFFKTDMAINAQQYPTLVEAIDLWLGGDVNIIAPQMIPVM